MIGILTGFAVIGVLILIGYVLERTGVLGAAARPVLGRFVFFAAAPALLFTVIARADPSVLISPLLAVSGLAALVSAAVYVLVARVAWRRALGPLTVGALASGYVNANNIGLPVAVYVLGNAAWTAPVILLQLGVFAPVALIVLDGATREGRRSVGRTALASLRNPLVLGSLLGFAVAMTGATVPALVLQPLRLLAGASVPLMLTGFGMSLVGARPLGAGDERRDVVLASVLKTVLMPAVALLLGLLVHLPPDRLHAAVVLAALPTAQNVQNYAQRYDTGVVLARDTGLITTIAAVPVLLLASLLLTGASVR